MKVVSNTSPITNFAAIQQLDLLHLIYDTIMIPQAVYKITMIQLHPNFLTQNGQKVFAVLPDEEYLLIQEMLEGASHICRDAIYRVSTLG